MRNKEDPLLVTLNKVCAGQDVRGFFSTEDGVTSIDRNLQMAFVERPWIIPGHVNPFYWIGRVWAVVTYLATLEPRWLNSAKLPHSAKERARFLAHPQDGHDHFGDWNSMAGRMLEGCQGRARCWFGNYIVVTDQELLVVAVSNNEKHGQITFHVPLTDVAWTRKLHRQKHRIQFGFSDGSWHTSDVYRHYKTFPEFAELFPQTLPHTAKIPDVLAGPESEGVGS